jgi:tetratricopeptide (TPR) repeat protein/ribonuclease BN (tRNA processing enzyme)
MSDRYKEALEAANAALVASRDTGDKVSEVNALRSKATALRKLGQHEEALETANAALAISQVAGDKLSEAKTLRIKAKTLDWLGRYEEALETANAALAISQVAGDKEGEANSLREIAESLRMLDRYEDALEAANAALAISQAEGDKVGEANAFRNKAECLGMLGRYEDALEAANAALAISQAEGDKVGEANSLRPKAKSLRMLDRYEEALETANAALAIFRAEGNKLGEATSLREIADSLRLLDRNEESLEAANAALAASKTVNSKLGEANALRCIASTLRMLDRYEDALEAANAALAAYQAARDKVGEANALSSKFFSLSELGKELDRADVLEKLKIINSDRAKRIKSYPLRPGWYAKIKIIQKDAKKREGMLRKVLLKPPCAPKHPPDAIGLLQVMRKWASYSTIPLMCSDDKHPDANTGGGYFLWWQGWGAVIDPGLGFGKGFREADFVPRNISSVIVTHHHIDHTGDMLPIVTCIFEMNETGKPHEVDFLLAPGAFSSFADLVAYLPGSRSVQLLRPGEGTTVILPGQGKAEVKAVQAIHRDLTGRTDAAIGLRVDLQSTDGKRCRIGISGDTRYVDNSDKTAEIYKDVDLMILHIGSIYPSDVGDEDKESWHLGFSGTINIIEDIKKVSGASWNPLILISEWGEELSAYRTEICEIISNEVNLQVWPAEYLQCVGLCHEEAKPVCDRGDGLFATHWDVEDHDKIVYRCDDHTHGKIKK